MKSFNKEKIKAVIEDTLNEIGLYSESAVNLLLGTCAQESAFGQYWKQINGPALGVFQMEPNTLKDIWNNFIKYRSKLKVDLYEVFGYDKADLYLLETDLIYQIIMSRIFYLRVKAKLPDSDDIEGMAKYWKKYYNTYLGRGKEEEFIKNYHRYVLGGVE